MAFDFLAGTRVLDLSQYVPGPYATLLLADLGAEVVKVEPPGGEPMRRLLLRDRDGVSPLYKVVNGGKTVVELDLKSAEGRDALAGLIAAGDVLLESYRPGVLDRLGFDRDRLRALNPGLVRCSLSGWGGSGPYRLKAGHDTNYMALGGGLVASGTAATPVIAWPPVADYASGIQAALTVVAALLRRGRTGEGADLDTSLMETVLAWQSGGLTTTVRAEAAPVRAAGLLNGGAACYQIYRTADGRFISTGNLEEKFWAAFCTALGHPEWIDRQWEPLPQTGLIEEVAAVVASRPLAHWEKVLGEIDSCFEPIRDFAEIADHPHVRARGLVQADGGEEPLVQILYPAWVDGAPPAPRPPVRFLDAGDVIAAWTRSTAGGDGAA